MSYSNIFCFVTNLRGILAFSKKSSMIDRVIDDCYSASNFDKQFFFNCEESACYTLNIRIFAWDFSLHIFLRIIIKAKYIYIYIACDFFFYKNNISRLMVIALFISLYHRSDLISENEEKCILRLSLRIV